MSEALMPTYARADIAVERGEGPYLFGAYGRRYLDFAGGIAVTLVAAAIIYLLMLWPLVRLLSRLERRTLARH